MSRLNVNNVVKTEHYVSHCGNSFMSPDCISMFKIIAAAWRSLRWHAAHKVNLGRCWRLNMAHLGVLHLFGRRGGAVRTPLWWDRPLWTFSWLEAFCIRHLMKSWCTLLISILRDRRWIGYIACTARLSFLSSNCYIPYEGVCIKLYFRRHIKRCGFLAWVTYYIYLLWCLNAVLKRFVDKHDTQTIKTSYIL